MDHNGHIVPDGTLAQFILSHNGDTVASQIEAQTVQGIARVTLRVDRSGPITLRVQSGPALLSDVLIYEIPAENLTPTGPPPAATITPSPTLTELSTLAPTNTPSPISTPIPPHPNAQVGLGDWLGALLAAGVIGGLNYWLVNQKRGLLWGVRAGFLALSGGLITYSYLALDLPGSTTLIEKYGIYGVLTVAILGAALGAGFAWAWQFWQSRRLQNA
jgi:hypothetical protein